MTILTHCVAMSAGVALGMLLGLIFGTGFCYAAAKQMILEHLENDRDKEDPISEMAKPRTKTMWDD